MMILHRLIQAMLLMPGLLALAAAAPVYAQQADENDAGRVVASLDFTQQTDGNAVSWLSEQGFELKLDAEQINPHFENDRLVLKTSGQHAGLIAREMKIHDADRVRITWGVSEYPEGADWKAGVYRVPIAVMISFGDETVDSGSAFVPDAPYFIGLFLGEHEQEGRAYKAQYYRKGGRYFCQPCSPEPGRTVTTEFEFDKVLEQNFNISSQLPVTSVGIQMNTNDTRGGARAFVKKIEFLADSRTDDIANLTDLPRLEE